MTLHRLEERGLVDSEWGLSDKGKRARFYRLTTAEDLTARGWTPRRRWRRRCRRCGRCGSTRRSRCGWISVSRVSYSSLNAKFGSTRAL